VRIDADVEKVGTVVVVIVVGAPNGVNCGRCGVLLLDGIVDEKEESSGVLLTNDDTFCVDDANGVCGCVLLLDPKVIVLLVLLLLLL
jgi:hypothetical protein